jgi:putative oxygen-independent coproporphyrinogen III oxidase
MECKQALCQCQFLVYKKPMENIAVYIHWPFCRKKCPYCDFNSHVSNAVNHQDWRNAYAQEIEYYAGLLGRRKVTSIFFGGGTPSLMEPETVAHVIKIIGDYWDINHTCEITLEANPTSIEAGKFIDFRGAGVNRVSVGIQSLRDEALKFLGREHSASEALKALAIANNVFDRVSFDLIYARPNQTMKDWQTELNEAITYAKGHLSLYQLTIEDGTQFKIMREKGQLQELDYDIAGDMYTMTADMMVAANMPAYEISNYACEGQESRHNLTYWRYQDYVGIGPGAHGRLTLPDGQKVATRTHKSPDKWMADVFGKGHGARPYEYLSAHDQMQEKLMMGLRLREGIDFASLREGNAEMGEGIKFLVQNNFLKIENGRLFVPQDKWPILDSILAKLILSV